MTLYRYNVTRVRAAACCPRIHYFDAEAQRRNHLKTRPLTMIWTEGDAPGPSGGKAFHTIVERFNSLAGRDPSIRASLDSVRDPAELHRVLMRFINAQCIDHEKLKEKPVSLRQHLIKVLTGYVAEVSESIARAYGAEVETAEIVERFFGDNRKRVDTTFHVGVDARVHVTGVVDHVYQDPKTGRHRIVDFKLTPATHPHKDLMQVMTYALMHHHQHGTQPDIAVYYLHPKRQTVELAWTKVRAERAKVYDLLASMVSWEDYDEKRRAGLLPPGDLTYCSVCKWSSECEKRLGSRSDGQWDHRWQSLTGAAGHDTEPKSVAVRPPRVIAPNELTEGRIVEEHERQVVAAIATQKETPEFVSLDTMRKNADIPTAGKLDEPVATNTLPSPFEVAVEMRETAASSPQIHASSAKRTSLEPDGAALSLEIGAFVKEEATATQMGASILNTHVAVVGAAGSGKTWMAKVIAEEAILANVPVLALDPQGDLVQFLQQREERDIPPEHRERYHLFRQRVEPRIFTPGTSHATRLSLEPVRLPSPQDLAKIADPQRRQEERHAMVSAVANNLVALSKAGGETDSQRNFLFQVLLAMPQNGQISLSKIVDGLYEPEQLGIDEPERFVKKAEREKLARKLHGFVHGPSAGLFEGGQPLDLAQLRRANNPGKVPLNVIYLNALTDDDQKHFFVATLASEIYRWMVTSLDSSGQTNLLLYLDEARDYIPAGTRQTAAKEPLIRLFTQGRKYGVGCLLCTQSPRSVDYSVFGNCSTKVIGRMEAAQDVERIGEWFSTSGAVPSWVARRKGADRGTFVARWPDMRAEFSGKQFKSRPLFSLHEGAWSPDRLEREMLSRR